MSTNTYNPVSYLKSLIKFFEGDFVTFKNVCSEIEKKEAAQTFGTQTNQPSQHNTSSYDSGNSSGTSGTSSTSGTSGNHNYTPILFETQTFFRLTIPVTLTMFSVIDTVGWLVGTHTMNGTTATDKNFKSFFKYYDNKKAVITDPDDVKLLNCLFRQGAVHRYFPKEELGVDYHSSNENKNLFFVPEDVKSNGIRLSLNVNKLYQIVSSSLTFLEADPDLASKDQRLQDLIESGYYINDKQMVQDYIKKINP